MPSAILLIMCACITVTVTTVVGLRAQPSSLLPNNPKLAGGCPCKDPRLCLPVQRRRGREVMSFSVMDGKFPYYDWTQLSTIAWNTDPQLMCLAHKHGARVVLNAGNVRPVLGCQESRTKWVQEHLELALQHFMDGTNFDLEEALTVEEVANYTLLVREASHAFRTKIPGAQISVDVAWSPFDVDGRNYDWKGLAEAADIFFVMAYDMESQMFGRCVAAANSPLALVEKGLQQWLHIGIPADKLVLGYPWYGYDYPCQSEQTGREVAPDTDLCVLTPVPFRGAPCSDAAGGERCYSDIMSMLARGVNATPVRLDPLSLSSYFNYIHQDGSVHQVWFDTVSNLKSKYELVSKYSLRGVGFWEVDCLAHGSSDPAEVKQTREMWDAVQTSLSTAAVSPLGANITT